MHLFMTRNYLHVEHIKFDFFILPYPIRHDDEQDEDGYGVYKLGFFTT